ncbi:hypothetical protein [Desulfoplanes sp.]
MGLYLQFNQGQAVEVLVQEKAVSQLRNVLSRLGDWGMHTLDEGGYIRARFFKEEDCTDGCV